MIDTKFRSLSPIFLLAAALTAGAQEAPTYDQIDLSASAERDVENDLLVAVVYAQEQDARQSVAADQVNQTISWVLEQADDVRSVRSQTLQYGSFPVYGNNRRITAWQVRQSVRLESTDTDALSELLGELQARAAIESVNYDASSDARDAANDELIAAALARFSERATLVATELGRPGYRIVRINIQTGDGSRNPVFLPNMARMASDSSESVAAPSLEAGTQRMIVSVSGTIELDPPR